MSHEPSTGWIDRRVHAAMRDEVGALRAAIETLGTDLASGREADRAEMAAARESDRLELAAARDADRAEAMRAVTELSELRATLSAQIADTREQAERVERALREAIETAMQAATAEIEPDGRIEPLRLRVEGLIAQHRWDMDQLRQSLAAVAEQLVRAH